MFLIEKMLIIFRGGHEVRKALIHQSENPDPHANMLVTRRARMVVCLIFSSSFSACRREVVVRATE